MLKKIQINCGRMGWWPVWAWVDGVFAIHKENNKRSEGWVLTHIPTGMGIGRNDSGKKDNKKEILEKLQLFKSLEWRGVNPLETYPPCELLTIAPLISDDLKKQNSRFGNPDYWEKDYQLEALEALNCKV